MNSEAELSSILAQLSELTTRVSVASEELMRAKQEDRAADLFEVERLMRTATRRLDRMNNGRR